ncbi:hypothetical protein PM082_016651 [Marasmius tenuissimus]|nr:hypothetical protein PM082_016651 [Marasmius tenuissimus]
MLPPPIITTTPVSPMYGRLSHELSNETPRARPTITIPSLSDTPFKAPLTPPTTPPLTPSSPTPTAELSSRSFLRSPSTPTIASTYNDRFERIKHAPEVTTVEIHTPISPPLTPPSQPEHLPTSVCPILGCRTKSSGRCIGAPVIVQEERPAATTGRKRKREARYHGPAESSTTDGLQPIRAHSPRMAPCNDCLDDDESLLWGSCDNPSCWSRRDGLEHSARSEGKGKRRELQRSLALICPDCSPEGGLGCEHSWICDLCAFSDPSSTSLELPEVLGRRL